LQQAPVAQRIEHLTSDQRVGGSSPSGRASLSQFTGYISLVRKVLVTGFEPFHKSSSNPSQVIVEKLREEKIPNLYCEVLPVEFGKSAEVLIKIIEEVKPDVVISLGQAEGRNAITPERVAINLDDARIADNAGKTPHEEPISKSGPNAYFSTLPIRAITEEIKAAGIPSTMSLSAGTFVCNHLFYQIQHHCREKKVRSGFIHVPLMESQSEEFPGMPTMPLSQMVEAIKIAIEVSRR
jgi:pyroglutamyl-peptidase